MNEPTQETLPMPKLSLGPIAYYWPKGMVLDFYHAVATQPVDIVYLGEVVCAKRHELKLEDWMDIGRMLKSHGKEVVLSTMTLLEAASERSRMRRVCEQKEFLVEANDMGAVETLIGLQQPFITGAAINIYNERTLKLLHQQGLKRWHLSVELGKQQLQVLQQKRPSGLETEVLVWGRLPLAYSARCYTARAHNLPKDQCQFKCIQDPDGMIMKTRERESFLCLNGIQTQSALTNNLMPELVAMSRMSVDVIRISPQSVNTFEIINAFHTVCQNPTVRNLNQPMNCYAPEGVCDGYWFGESGMQRLHAGSQP